MQTYVSRRREQPLPTSVKRQHSTPVLPVNGILPAETLGRQVDLPKAIREKMETSFGADLSRVKLYESQAVADAGAEAMTVGSKIGFAPGKLDFASSGGQALLGHELSHVVSQARGEVTGSGFLNDSALEARADREGAMAAAGESVYPVTPVSASSPAAGPMQAKKTKDDEEMQISEPTLVRHESVQQPEDGMFKVVDDKTDPQFIKSNYRTPESAALAMIVNHASEEQLRGDKTLRRAVLNDYKQNMGARLKPYDTDTFHHMGTVMRSQEAGERITYEKLMKGNLPKGMLDHMAKQYTSDTVDDALDYAGETVMQDENMKEILSAGKETLEQSKHFENNQEKSSEMTMNSLILRAVGPGLIERGAKDLSIRTQKAVNENKNDRTQGGVRFLRRLLEHGTTPEETSAQ